MIVASSNRAQDGTYYLEMVRINSVLESVDYMRSLLESPSVQDNIKIEMD